MVSSRTPAYAIRGCRIGWNYRSRIQWPGADSLLTVCSRSRVPHASIPDPMGDIPVSCEVRERHTTRYAPTQSRRECGRNTKIVGDLPLLLNRKRSSDRVLSGKRVGWRDQVAWVPAGNPLFTESTQGALFCAVSFLKLAARRTDRYLLGRIRSRLNADKNAYF